MGLNRLPLGARSSASAVPTGREASPRAEPALQTKEEAGRANGQSCAKRQLVRPEGDAVEARPVAPEGLPYLGRRVGAREVGRAGPAEPRDGRRATGPGSARLKPAAVVGAAKAADRRTGRPEAVAGEAA